MSCACGIVMGDCRKDGTEPLYRISPSEGNSAYSFLLIVAFKLRFVQSNIF
jgi:hypothetical protein